MVNIKTVVSPYNCNEICSQHYNTNVFVLLSGACQVQLSVQRMLTNAMVIVISIGIVLISIGIVS